MPITIAWPSHLLCAQVDGYKELLLKQRDIMMALTKRLSERDELIMSLQEELDAYDAAQRRLEDDLDHRTAEIIAMRKAAIEEVSKISFQHAHPMIQSVVGGSEHVFLLHLVEAAHTMPDTLDSIHSHGVNDVCTGCQTGSQDKAFARCIGCMGHRGSRSHWERQHGGISTYRGTWATCRCCGGVLIARAQLECVSFRAGCR